MSVQFRLSKKSVVYLAVGVVLVAFLGVMAGTWFTEWRQNAWKKKRLEGLATGESSGLRAGQIVPDIPLVSLDGKTSSTLGISSADTSLYLFISIGCDLCTEVTRAWYSNVEQVPAGVRVFGICQDAVDYARVYVQKTGFPFPLYCDTGEVFTRKYYMDIYPTVMGLLPGGRIAFIQHGVREDYTPMRAMEQLANRK